MGFISTIVDAVGSVFNGRWPIIMDDYVQHIQDSLAEEAITRIRTYLPNQYMYLGHNGGSPLYNPIPANAGELVAAIHSERQTEERVIVTDTPVTYGPWIEGVSALNEVVWPGRLRRGLPGRFPGYHTFRIVAQQLDAEAGLVAERDLYPYLIELNT